MNKNRGIWLVIALILIVGTAVTVSTRKFISRQETAMASETAAGETAVFAALDKDAEPGVPYPAAGAQPGMYQAPAKAGDGAERKAETAALSAAKSPEESPRPASADISPEMAGETAPFLADGAAPGAAAESETIRSPLEKEPVNSAVKQVEEKVASGSYMTRLEELDAKVKRMWEESGDSTTYGLKSVAERELLLWDTELNAMYKVLMESLDEEAAGQLKKDEQNWIKERDAKAAAAAEKYRGGTMEGLEYTAAMAAVTRQRVYDLAEAHQEILE